MSRNRQRRKERRAAANEQEAREVGAVAPKPAPEQPPVVAGGTESDEEVAQREESEAREDEAQQLIEALDNSARPIALTAGITVFTAMLEQARAGYAADRLAELEAALSLNFNALEAQGIVQIAMANMGETGVPDVEHGIQLCIEARVEIDARGETPAEQVGLDPEKAESLSQDDHEAIAAAEEEEQARFEARDEEETERIAAEEAEADKPGPED